MSKKNISGCLSLEIFRRKSFGYSISQVNFVVAKGSKLVRVKDSIP